MGPLPHVLPSPPRSGLTSFAEDDAATITQEDLLRVGSATF